MMKFTTLSMIHGVVNQPEETGEKKNEFERKNREKNIRNLNATQVKQTPKKNGQDELTAVFSHAPEGSDAESQSEKKWCGVPHWESRPEYTNELAGQVLVEHEIQGGPFDHDVASGSKPAEKHYWWGGGVRRQNL